jgi:hypothetical protein
MLNNINRIRAARNSAKPNGGVIFRKTKFDGTKLPLVVRPSPHHNGWREIALSPARKLLLTASGND